MYSSAAPSLFDTSEAGRTPITLRQLQQIISGLVSVPETQGRWVTAELSDVRPNRAGHVYMELLEKEDDGAKIVAKAKAVIWAGRAQYVVGKFMAATGQQLTDSIKVMVCVSVSHHPQYGLTYVISDIDPSYTIGDRLRRRRQMIEKLTKEGIIDQNKELPWAVPAQRIAVISAGTAAGYGDFFKHLHENKYCLRFHCKLYPAFMQGERTPLSIINALEAIAADDSMAAPGEGWDAVVVIRGGGATSDLSDFENYELAAAIATFPIPVIIGVGHDRDNTILDYVGAASVKTPTAAADIFINKGIAELSRIDTIARDIAAAPMNLLSSHWRTLSALEARLPMLPQRIVDRATTSLNTLSDRLSSALSARIASATLRLDSIKATISCAADCSRPETVRLNALAERMSAAIAARIAASRNRIDYLENMARALSPTATLRRGYSITRINGKAITSASQLVDGDTISTYFADGTVHSTVTSTPTSPRQ